jgi:hypothetical protein
VNIPNHPALDIKKMLNNQHKPPSYRKADKKTALLSSFLAISYALT